MIDKEYNGKRVAFFTLGCKLNFSETSTMARKFEDLGFTRVDFKEEADVYVVNSCSVTNDSDRKSRNMIRGAIKRNTDAVMMVTGCYAQLKSDEVASIEGVDYVLGSGEKLNITSYINDLHKNESPVISFTDHKKIKEFHKAYSYGDRTRTFLKVQDGCDYFCSYCTIPLARGRSRNDSVENTVNEAIELGKKGVKEVILTGVNIGDFGQSTSESFLDLIKGLDQVPGIERYRISSIEPNLLTDEIIDFVASSKKFMPHFHIPLQSGSDEVLKLMKRKYLRERFADRVEKIKAKIPNAFIGVDMIAGTNGETEAYFNDALDFIRDLDVTQIHCFPYSERNGTKALEIEGVVPVPERKKRVKRLIEISDRKMKLFYEAAVGHVYPVLFEMQNNGDQIYGWTNNYIRVQAKWNESLVNGITMCKIISISEDGIANCELVEVI